MYLDQGEPSEKCGELNFGLEYDFATQTLKLKIIQVSHFTQWENVDFDSDLVFCEKYNSQCSAVNKVFENHKKVSFNIMSEASYVYILSGQKFTENAKNAQFGEFDFT